MLPMYSKLSCNLHFQASEFASHNLVKFHHIFSGIVVTSAFKIVEIGALWGG